MEWFAPYDGWEHGGVPLSARGRGKCTFPGHHDDETPPHVIPLARPDPEAELDYWVACLRATVSFPWDIPEWILPELHEEVEKNRWEQFFAFPYLPEAYGTYDEYYYYYDDYDDGFDDPGF